MTKKCSALAAHPVAHSTKKLNRRISFMTFLKTGFPLMLLTIAIAHAYMLLAYDL